MTILQDSSKCNKNKILKTKEFYEQQRNIITPVHNC